MSSENSKSEENAAKSVIDRSSEKRDEVMPLEESKGDR